MLRQGTHLLGVLFWLMVASCSTQTMDEIQLKDFISDEKNGLTKSTTVNGQTVRITYRPIDLLVCNEVMAKGIKDPGQIQEMRKQYENNLYFVLSLSANKEEITHQSLGDSEVFEKAVKQLAFGMNRHVYLVNSRQDTVPVLDYIYPRMYGGTSGTSMMFVFPKDKLDQAAYIDFCLDEFGYGTGNQKFRFETKAIKNIPQLNFTSN